MYKRKEPKMNKDLVKSAVKTAVTVIVTAIASYFGIDIYDKYKYPVAIEYPPAIEYKLDK